jgi:hypothetical protein
METPLSTFIPTSSGVSASDADFAEHTDRHICVLSWSEADLHTEKGSARLDRAC